MPDSTRKQNGPQVTQASVSADSTKRDWVNFNLSAGGFRQDQPSGIWGLVGGVGISVNTPYFGLGAAYTGKRQNFFEKTSVFPVDVASLAKALKEDVVWSVYAGTEVAIPLDDVLGLTFGPKSGDQPKMDNTGSSHPDLPTWGWGLLLRADIELFKLDDSTSTSGKWLNDAWWYGGVYFSGAENQAAFCYGFGTNTRLDRAFDVDTEDPFGEDRREQIYVYYCGPAHGSVSLPKWFGTNLKMLASPFAEMSFEYPHNRDAKVKLGDGSLVEAERLDEFTIVVGVRLTL